MLVTKERIEGFSLRPQLVLACFFQENVQYGLSLQKEKISIFSRRGDFKKVRNAIRQTKRYKNRSVLVHLKIGKKGRR